MATATMQIDLQSIFAQVPKGAWVALSSDMVVIAYGAEITDVIREAHTTGELHPLILKVPEQPGALML